MALRNYLCSSAFICGSNDFPYLCVLCALCGELAGCFSLESDAFEAVVGEE